MNGLRPIVSFRLYLSEFGTWRYVIDRGDGDPRWGSTRTKDETKAKLIVANWMGYFLEAARRRAKNGQAQA